MKTKKVKPGKVVKGLGSRVPKEGTPAEPTQKKDLGPGSTAKEKFHALIDAADYFNSDLAQVIGRDDDGQVLFVCLFARGEYARPLLRPLKKLEALDK